MRQQLSHCLCCQEPLSGRRDKKFCSNSCKAQHHRAASFALAGSVPASSVPTSVLAESLLRHSPWEVLRACYADESTYKVDCYRRLAAAQEADAPFDEEYAIFIEQFLYCQFDDIRSSGYTDAAQELTRVITGYSQHPGLLIPGHLAHHRLADLYLLHSLFHALHHQTMAGEARGPYTVGQGPERPAYYEYLSERSLKQLWANLLGVS